MLRLREEFMSRRTLLAGLFALGLAGAASAQGVCPDGLSGACCTGASPSLPSFPSVTWSDGRQMCVIDCNSVRDQYFQLTMSAPVPLLTGCGTDFDVTLTSSGPELCPMPGANTLRLNYTRRWQQAFPGLGNLIVYRFVATGSLCVSPGFCAVEGPPQHPFVFGMVDYAFRLTGPPSACNRTFVGAAVALGHSCDRYMHDASCAFTQDPVSSHPFDEYVLVAPGSNFTPNLGMVPPQGPSTLLAREGLRWIQPNSAGICTVREPLASLALANVVAHCPCLSGTPPQSPYWRQRLTTTTSCGTTVATVPFCPFSPPTVTTMPFDTLMAWSIGSWGIGQFPGTAGAGNRFFLAQGSVSAQSAASSPCPLPPVRTVYYGVENQWANNGKRVDLVDNAQQVPGTTLFQPVVGGVTPPGVPSGTHVLYFY